MNINKEMDIELGMAGAGAIPSQPPLPELAPNCVVLGRYNGKKTKALTEVTKIYKEHRNSIPRKTTGYKLRELEAVGAGLTTHAREQLGLPNMPPIQFVVDIDRTSKLKDNEQRASIWNAKPQLFQHKLEDGLVLKFVEDKTHHFLEQDLSENNRKPASATAPPSANPAMPNEAPNALHLDGPGPYYDDALMDGGHPTGPYPSPYLCGPGSLPGGNDAMELSNGGGIASGQSFGWMDVESHESSPSFHHVMDMTLPNGSFFYGLMRSTAQRTAESPGTKTHSTDGAMTFAFDPAGEELRKQMDTFLGHWLQHNQDPTKPGETIRKSKMVESFQAHFESCKAQLPSLLKAFDNSQLPMLRNLKEKILIDLATAMLNGMTTAYHQHPDSCLEDETHAWASTIPKFLDTWSGSLSEPSSVTNEHHPANGALFLASLDQQGYPGNKSEFQGCSDVALSRAFLLAPSSNPPSLLQNSSNPPSISDLQGLVAPLPQTEAQTADGEELVEATLVDAESTSQGKHKVLKRILFVFVLLAVIATAILAPLFASTGSDGSSGTVQVAQKLCLRNQTKPFSPYLQRTIATDITEDPCSSQARANEWMLNDPDLQNYTEDRQIQRFMMVSVWYSLNAENTWEKWDDWLSYDVPECEWYTAHPNQTVCDDNNVLRVLNLTSNGLKGTIPTEALTLIKTKVIDLSHNRVSGEIPPMTKEVAETVEHVDVSYNNLEGQFHVEFGVGGMSLRYFNLRDNQFTGAIPVQNLASPHLVHLDVTNNKLVGKMPTMLGAVSNLEVVLLGGNSLSGTIPDIGMFHRLKEVDMSGNSLSGTIPAAVGNLKELRSIDLSGNAQFRGTIPSAMGSLPHLEWADVRGTNMFGSIPSVLCEKQNAGALELDADCDKDGGIQCCPK